MKELLNSLFTMAVGLGVLLVALVVVYTLASFLPGAQMLVVTKGGFTYRQADYRSWLSEAGFASVEIMTTPTPATVLLAR